MIIRNNYKNLPRKSNKIAAPKYSIHIKITDLGRDVAKWLMKEDYYVDSYGYTKLSSKQRKQLVEQIKKRLTK
ncbi:hypothetical protein [Nostoc sp. ChiVER01]|uniref:hypothetical protein n=1 Tax=Nostoc sp. ChiVER01 TaxID=3075382 RepID=UPI002AD3D69F|nr:hypothetical protein [Nostoc sp. ChiVER01]MDZ8227133.1 hypothetical protein [Nostoc sp. ChiVER01]